MRCLVRDERKSARGRGLGLRDRPGDVTNPEASGAPWRVRHRRPPGRDHRGPAGGVRADHERGPWNVVAAAKDAGVSRFVLMSALGVNEPRRTPCRTTARSGRWSRRSRRRASRASSSGPASCSGSTAACSPCSSGRSGTRRSRRSSARASGKSSRSGWTTSPRSSRGAACPRPRNRTYEPAARSRHLERALRTAWPASASSGRRSTCPRARPRAGGRARAPAHAAGHARSAQDARSRGQHRAIPRRRRSPSGSIRPGSTRAASRARACPKSSTPGAETSEGPRIKPAPRESETRLEFVGAFQPPTLVRRFPGRPRGAPLRASTSTTRTEESLKSGSPPFRGTRSVRHSTGT